MFRRSSICSNDIKIIYSFVIIIFFLFGCSIDPNLFSEQNSKSNHKIVYLGQKKITKEDLPTKQESKIEAFHISLPVPKPNKGLNFNVPSLIWPVAGKKITSFGQEEQGIHNDGINILADYGSLVLSTDDGEVVFVGFNLKGFGSIVLIRHSNGWISSYAHLSKILVKQGDLVKQGQELGLVGNTGRVSRPQLYFEIRDSEKPINPEIYLSS